MVAYDDTVDFDELQGRLGAALDANTAGSQTPHVLVAMPSYSVGESLLSHYAGRIPVLEHRYLLASLILARIESCELVFVSSREPEPDVLAYYAALLPDDVREQRWPHFRILTVPDGSARSVAAKLLDHPQLIDDLRRSFAGRPALIEPWNVTDAEVGVARRLRAPINGSAPALRGLAFKSAGRRLFARAGVPTPAGREDVRSLDDVVEAIAAIRADRPGVPGVVIKHDDSGAGDGNVVIDLLSPQATGSGLRERLERLSTWYRDDLRNGGVVEELVGGEWTTSPSVQLDIRPSGNVVVLSTHEQMLGGENGQVYTGCRFPAQPAYAAEIGRYALAAGGLLAAEGAVGRASVDFVAARSAAGTWTVAALEINLRKGGTTHPFCALRNLVPGAYDVEAGTWTAADGKPRAYISTDNAVDEVWRGVLPQLVIDSIARAGLQFDHRTGTGVVLHMLSGLAIDGRFGLTAIGRSAEHAEELYQRSLRCVASAAQASR